MAQLSRNEKMPCVPLSQLRKLTKKTENLPEDTDITLELVLTALFPTVWTNIQLAMNDHYTQGYLAGREDERNAHKGNN